MLTRQSPFHHANHVRSNPPQQRGAYRDQRPYQSNVQSHQSPRHPVAQHQGSRPAQQVQGTT